MRLSLSLLAIACLSIRKEHVLTNHIPVHSWLDPAFLRRVSKRRSRRRSPFFLPESIRSDYRNSLATVLTVSAKVAVCRENHRIINQLGHSY